jgi:dienelactone hydrolase
MRKILQGFCFLSLSMSLRAADPVETWLGREIIGPTQTLTDVQAFTESRVPLMPEVKRAREWDRIAARLRRETLDRVVFRGEAARWRAARTKVEWLDTIAGGPGYRIKKLRFEALPGLWIPALLYEPETLSGRVPVNLNVNGHDPEGKVAPYKQLRCINQAKRGMLALNVEWFDKGQLQGAYYNHAILNQLDLCGASGVAPFYLAMERALDLLLALEHADRKRVSVSGLSGGGWQTILISSLDPRVTLANPVAGYSSFRSRAHNPGDLGDAEQMPCDLATVVDYTHLTAMRAPRPTLLTYNAKDNCCFLPENALPPLLDAALPIYKLYGKADNLRFHINYDPGTHNFEQDNREAFYHMLGDHFFADATQFNASEIPSATEVKTKEQLMVALPENNADFNSLALALSKNLPRHPEVPTGKSALNRWQRKHRATLRALVHAKDYPVATTKIASDEKDGVQVAFWRLKLTNEWTLPVVDLTRGEPNGTTLLIADEGRKSVAAEAERLLAAGQRVLAVDLFSFGESKIAQRDYLFALLVAAVGERPLGLQSSQLNAVARWSGEQHKNDPLSVIAVGPRSSLIALVAAGLDQSAIGGLEFHGVLGNLKEIIEKNWTADQAPEMFCFGLLETFDIEQLEALVAPRNIVKK